jgi:CRP/FNR family cyclic AMP-dependent transcriptional regulator
MATEKLIETVIAEHPFFRELRSRYLKLIARGAETVSFGPNQVLFREGEYASRFYLIQSGRVALESVPGGRPALRIQVLPPGEVLGWSWLFPPYHWHFQARALEPTTAISLDAPHLLIACEDSPELGYVLMKRISQVLIQRLQSTRQQLIQGNAPGGGETGERAPGGRTGESSAQSTEINIQDESGDEL